MKNTKNTIIKTAVLIILAVSLISFFSSLAYAGQCEDAVRGMTDKTIQQTTLATCLQAEKESSGTKSVAVDILSDPDKLDKIVGTYSTALGKMASDLGIAANEFIKTDAGKIATFSILYTIFGEDLRGLIFGPFLSFVIFLLWFGMYRFMYPMAIVTDKEGNKTKYRIGRYLTHVSHVGNHGVDGYIAFQQFMFNTLSIVAPVAIVIILLTSLL